MPVAHITTSTTMYGPKQIQAPKEASLKGWWNAARKSFLVMPRWTDIRDTIEYTADESIIHFKWRDCDLLIARKRHLR